MANQQSYASKKTRVSNAVAAGTTDINSSSVDMANFEGVVFDVFFGTLTSTAVTSIKLQQSSDDGVSDAFSDLEASSVTVADDDDNQQAVAEVWRPQKRYVRCVVDRGTANAVVDAIGATQYQPRVLPTTDDASTIVGRVVLTSPDEGTA